MDDNYSRAPGQRGSIMQLEVPQGARTYRSKTGLVIASNTDSDHNGLFASCDGRRFVQCYVLHSRGDLMTQQFGGMCIKPDRDMQKFHFRCVDGQLTVGTDVLKACDSPTTIEYEPLPTTRRPGMLFRLYDEDRRYFYVSSLVFGGTHPMGQLQAHLGPLGAMVVYPHVTARIGRQYLQAQRIETVDGTFFLRPPRWVPKNPREGRRIEAETLDLEDYVIVETDEGPTITERVGAAA